MKRIQEIYKFSQSIWYDNIQRKLLDSGEIKKMVDVGEITGITSNPTIFEKAIGSSNDYDSQIKALVQKNSRISTDDLYEQLVISDIQRGADLLAPVFHATKGADGYISLEVSPRLAYNTQATIEEAKRLFKAVNRPNVMIKVPATTEGIPAITTLISLEIPVNVTLMFSIKDFDDVVEAYLSGLEKLAQRSNDLSKVASVASFFISRMDTAVDKILPAQSPLLGKTAIAYAKSVYKKFEQVYAGERFIKLQKKGARIQRLLWASTGTKNPQYSDVLYVEELIGANTVNTVPPATLDAFRDHGKARLSVTEKVNEAIAVLDQVKKHGVDLSKITNELKQQGVDAFSKSFDSLMDTLQKKRASL